MMKAEAAGGRVQGERRAGHYNRSVDHHLLRAAFSRHHGRGHKMERLKRQVRPPSPPLLGLCTQPALTEPPPPGSASPKSPLAPSHQTYPRCVLPSGAALLTATCSFITHSASVKCLLLRVQGRRVRKPPDLICILASPVANDFNSPKTAVS